MADEMEVDACLVRERPERRNGSDRFRLQAMRDVLVEALDICAIEKLQDSLLAGEIFNTEENNIVFYEPVPENKMRKLLNILETKVDMSRDPPVLDILVDFLRDYCGNEQLAQNLIEAQGIPKGYKHAEEALKHAESITLTDRILGGVVRHIGPTWESIARDELGVSDIKIENFKSVLRDPYEIKFKVFNAWKQKSGFRPGSLVILLKAFKDNYDRCSVDWPQICAYLSKENK